MDYDRAEENKLAWGDAQAAAETGKELLYITNDTLGERERLMIACKDHEQELRVLRQIKSYPIET